MSAREVVILVRGPDESGIYIVTSTRHPVIEVTSSDADYAIHFVRGAVLCAMGQWKHVPDRIEFKTETRAA